MPRPRVVTPPRAVVGRGEEADLLAMVDDGLGDRRADLYEPRERRLVEARRDGELLSTSRHPCSTRLRRRRASSSARVRAGARHGEDVYRSRKHEITRKSQDPTGQLQPRGNDIVHRGIT